MNLTTDIKKALKEIGQVAIPRKEYEEFLELRKIIEFKPTPIQLKALRKAESNLAKGKALGYGELVQKLGFKN